MTEPARTFPRMFRGYDTGAVDAHIQALATKQQLLIDDVESLRTRLKQSSDEAAQLRKEVADLTDTSSTPHAMQQRMAKMLRRAVDEVSQMQAEARARRHGYRSFSVRATPLSAGFFQRLGYEITSHGSMAVDKERSLPLTFLRRTDPAVVTTAGEAANVPGRPPGRPQAQRPVNIVDIMSTAAGKAAPLQKFAEP